MAPNQVIGCLQTPGAILRFALRFFFGKTNFLIYEKKVDLCVFLRKLIIQTPGAMLRFALRFFRRKQTFQQYNKQYL